MKQLYLFFSSLLILTMPLQAQVHSPSANLLSPNASSLGLYGEVPVSLYTGIPNISIPIFTVDVGNLKIPMSLDYHASGVRPDQHPGWVGLGWTLRAGGSISRVVKGLPDDFKNTYSYNLKYKIENVEYGFLQEVKEEGFYYSYNLLNNSINNIISSSVVDQNGKYMGKDSEPDEFSFNMGDLSGKFYIGTDGEFKVLCNRPVKVEFTGKKIDNSRDLLTGIPNFSGVNISQPGGGPEYGVTIHTIRYSHFTEFTITDEYGNKYIFGDKNTGFDINPSYYLNPDYSHDTGYIEYSVDFFNQATTNNNQRGGLWTADTWMLRKIISTNRDQLNFYYNRGPFINQITSTVNNTITGGEGYTNSDGIKASYEGRLISPVYLFSIKGSEADIEFNSSESNELCYDEDKYKPFNGLILDQSSNNLPTMEFLQHTFDELKLYKPVPYGDVNSLSNLKWMKLDKISVSLRNGSKYRTVNFNYNNTAQERLKLDSIDFTEGTSSLKQNYALAYYNFGGLPGYLSEQTDHWGFYKGNNSLFLDDVSGKYFNINGAEDFFNKKEPANKTTSSDPLAIAKTGTLTKISYPTGGSVEFEYEQNTYATIAGKESEDNQKNKIPYTRTQEQSNISGGLRVSKITKNTESDAGSIVTTYDYNYNGRSTGVLSGEVCYQYNEMSDDLKIVDNQKHGLVSQAFSSETLLPMSENTAGAHVTYTKVREYTQSKGSIEYTYTNYDNGNPDLVSIVKFKDFHSSQGVQRGLLKEKVVYDQSGNKVMTSKTDYSIFCENPNSVKYFKTKVMKFYGPDYVPTGSNGALSIITDENGIPIQTIKVVAYVACFLDHYIYSYLPYKQTVEYFSANAPCKKNVTTYNYHAKFPLLTNEYHSINDVQVYNQNYIYPFQLYTGNEAPTDGDILKKRYFQMTTQYFLNYPVETYKINGENKVYNAIYNEYIENETLNSLSDYIYSYDQGYVVAHKDIINDYVLGSTYSLKINAPLDLTTFSSLTSTNPTLKDVHYGDADATYKYDKMSDIIQINDKSGVCSYLWGDNVSYGKRLVAEIKNASFSELRKALGYNETEDIQITDNYIDLWEKLSTYWKDKPVQIRTFDYEKNTGLRGEKKANGILMKYEFNNANRLENISRNSTILKRFEYHYYNQNN